MTLIGELETVHRHLWWSSALIFVAALFYLPYYPLTRSFPVDWVSSPALQGIPVTVRGNSLEWWTNVFTNAMLIVPIFWIGLMVCYFKVRFLKLIFLVFLAVSTAVWLSILIIHISWINGRNNPLDPSNPASSDARCCAPEYYLAVPSCKNYGLPDPTCNPPWALSDLGVNRDEIFVICFLSVFIMVWVCMIYFTVQLLRLMATFDELMALNNASAGAAPAGTTTMAYTSAPVQPRPFVSNVSPFSVSSGGGGRK